MLLRLMSLLLGTSLLSAAEPAINARLISGDWDRDAQDVQFRLHSYHQTWAGTQASTKGSAPLSLAPTLAFELRAPLGYKLSEQSQRLTLALRGASKNSSPQAHAYAYADDDAASYFMIEQELSQPAHSSDCPSPISITFSAQQEASPVQVFHFSKGLALRQGRLRLSLGKAADLTLIQLNKVTRDKGFYEIQFGDDENHLRRSEPLIPLAEPDCLLYSFESCARPQVFRIIRSRREQIITLPLKEQCSAASLRFAPSKELSLAGNGKVSIKQSDLDISFRGGQSELMLLFQLQLPSGYQLESSPEAIPLPRSSGLSATELHARLWTIPSLDCPQLCCLSIYCAKLPPSGCLKVEEILSLKTYLGKKMQTIAYPLHFVLTLPQISTQKSAK